jgi:hypothetical protein
VGNDGALIEYDSIARSIEVIEIALPPQHNHSIFTA